MPRGDRREKGHLVMLQSPGGNVATLGVLLMFLVHVGVLVTWKFVGEGAANQLYEEGGLTWAGVVSGKVWQLFTHAWLHGDWGHLLANALLFYYAAARLSHVLGNRRMVALFLVTSVGAAVAHISMQAIFPGLREDVLVGASAGIMGMLFGFFAISPESRLMFLPVSARNVAKGVLISSIMFTLINPALGLPYLSEVGSWLGEAFKGVEVFRWAHFAHFVGGLTGWCCIERFFPKLLTRNDLARMRVDHEVVSEVR